MDSKFSDFETTMRGLERGLRVEEIATFDLKTFDVDLDGPAEVEEFRKQGIDYLPACHNGEVVGVLDINTYDGQCCENPPIKRLTNRMLVSAGDSISDTLPLFKESSYRLVVVKGNISGIVTKSDLLKLPVRVLAFSQITYLEMVMAAVIREKTATDNDWRDHLSDNRRTKISEKFDKLREQKSDPPLLECTDFCDKRVIVRKLLRLPAKFEKEMNAIEKLRNTLAHAGDYASDSASMVRFIDQMTTTAFWITELRSKLRISDATPTQNLMADTEDGAVE